MFREEVLISRVSHPFYLPESWSNVVYFTHCLMKSPKNYQPFLGSTGSLERGTADGAPDGVGDMRMEGLSR